MSVSNRKLAAIVFTDIVGFTELTADNEPAALKLLETQRKLLKPIVESFNGEWLKEIGDGLLLSFATNHEAVNCSVEIQRKVKSIENLNLRIGIHQGEVVFQGNDVIGDDVNIAARIEPFSAPGGIAVSGRVNVGLERDPDFDTSYIGRPSLKGVKQKVEVFCITSHGLPKTDLDYVSAKLEPEKKSITKRIILPLTGLVFTLIGAFVWLIFPLISFSIADEESRFEKKIAVLYFENKGQTDDTYFADGLTEEIITRLSRINNLSVASRYDVIGYKGKNIILDEIEEKLNADFILTGNVIRINDVLKISVELVNIDKRNVLWANSFEESLDNIFLVQDKVALNIVNNLGINISSKDKASVLIDPTKNTSLFDQLLKIKSQLPEFSSYENGIDTLIHRLNKIIESDSTFADAIATRGLYYFFKYYQKGYWIDKDLDLGKELSQAAIKDFETALYLDSKNLIALGSLPITYLISLWKIPSTTGKIFTARKAFVLFNDLKSYYPDNYMTNFVRGLYHRIKARMAALSNESDYDEAVKNLIKAIDQMRNGIENNALDPLVKKIYEEGLKTTASFVDTYNDYSLAIEYYDELIELYQKEKKFKNLEYTLENQIFVYLWTGYFEKSIDLSFKFESIAKLNESISGLVSSNLLIAKAYSEKGEPEIGLELLENLESEYIDEIKLLNQLRLKLYKSEIYFMMNDYSQAAIEIEKTIIIADSMVTKKQYNEYHLWLATGHRMYAESIAAKVYSELNDINRSNYYINQIETEIPKQPRLYFAESVNILNNLSLTYKKNGNKSKALEYKRSAIKEMNTIAKKLSEPDRNSYLNNIKLNKELQLTNS